MHVNLYSCDFQSTHKVTGTSLEEYFVLANSPTKDKCTPKQNQLIYIQNQFTQLRWNQLIHRYEEDLYIDFSMQKTL